MWTGGVEVWVREESLTGANIAVPELGTPEPTEKGGEGGTRVNHHKAER